MIHNPYDWFAQTKITAENIAVLKGIQKGFPSAIIAGGAIRDAFHGVPIRDVDIFVCHPAFSDDYPTMSQHEKDNMIFKERDMEEMFDLGEHDYAETKNSEYPGPISSIWNVYKDEVQYQLIILKMDPIEYVNNYFNIGLCKAYCDGTKIRYTSQFLDDMSNETLTVCGDLSEGEYHYCMKYYVPRIQEKYPHFSIVVDPKLKQYQKGAVIP